LTPFLPLAILWTDAPREDPLVTLDICCMDS
jgi:hypothetical protein